MTKSELRKKYIEKRQALTTKEYDSLNEKLFSKVKLLSWVDVKYVHCFWPMENMKEVNTKKIIFWLQNEKSHIKIVLPQANFKTLEMQHRLYTNASQMQANDYDIMEPINGVLVEPTLLDLVFVPLLSFDKQGYRVGYGKGFYDKFLAECSPETKFVGLSLFEPENIIEDRSNSDVKLHSCITPINSYNF